MRVSRLHIKSATSILGTADTHAEHKAITKKQQVRLVRNVLRLPYQNRLHMRQTAVKNTPTTKKQQATATKLPRNTCKQQRTIKSNKLSCIEKTRCGSRFLKPALATRTSTKRRQRQTTTKKLAQGTTLTAIWLQLTKAKCRGSKTTLNKI